MQVRPHDLPRRTHTRIRGHAGTRVSTDRTVIGRSAGGATSECTTRRLSRPPPFATDGSSPFSNASENRRGVHLPVYRSVYPLPHARPQLPESSIRRETSRCACISRCVRIAEGGPRGCVPARCVAVYSNLPLPLSLALRVRVTMRHYRV